MLPLIVVLILMIPILAIVLDSEVGRAIAKRLERRNLTDGDGGVHDRLVYLESELERLGREVGRLDEENQFFQQLLADRSDAGALLPGDRAGTSTPDR